MQRGLLRVGGDSLEGGERALVAATAETQARGGGDLGTAVLNGREEERERSVIRDSTERPDGRHAEVGIRARGETLECASASAVSEAPQREDRRELGFGAHAGFP